MFSRSITTLAVRFSTFVLVAGSSVLFGQQTAAPPAPADRTEFPVIMRQNVVAGKTPVGTKVQAELVVATMVNGVVVPRSAVLSGEVTESIAKSKTDPSRVGIRMDSAQWKNGSAPIKLYLTAWYYPEASMNQNISYQPIDEANSKRNWNGQGAYPDPNNPIAQERFPSGRDSSKDNGPSTPTPSSSISKHRVLMKNITSARGIDGAVALTSVRTNIKIDKLTTYVLADGDLLPN
jgi:hypothetical protein